MREITYAEAIREAMSEEMRRDENVYLLGEDVGIYGGAFGVSVGMIDEFGEERVRDTPISEAVIAGAAAGSAVTGMRPIAELMFMDFSTIAMDAIVNQAAKMRYMFGGKAQVPFVLRCPAGSGTGAAAQHSQSLEAWFCHIPGLKVVAPSTPYDVKGLLKSSIRDNNPVIFVEQKLLYRTKGEVPEEEYTIPLGVADIKRTGKDVTVVTYGRMLPRVLEAAEEARLPKEIDIKLYLKMFMRYLHKNHKRMYLLVESEEDGQEAFRYMQRTYSGIQLVGLAKVSAEGRADDMLVNAINGSEVDCVLSALSVPLQEDFIAKNRNLLDARVWIGVGKKIFSPRKPGFGQGKIAKYLLNHIFRREMEKNKLKTKS